MYVLKGSDCPPPSPRAVATRIEFSTFTERQSESANKERTFTDFCRAYSMIRTSNYVIDIAWI